MTHVPEPGDQQRPAGRRATLAEQLADLSQRLRRLEDIEAITAMHHDYVRLLADLRFDELADHFTEDAVIDMRSHGPKHGRGAIAAHFSGMGDVVGGGNGYILTSPVIEVDGDRATGHWTWHRLQADFPDGSGTVRMWGRWQEGRYRCEYRRTEQGWLFSRMHFRVVLPDLDLEHDPEHDPSESVTRKARGDHRGTRSP
jgi:ketosteroid isomerase-like protein